MSLSRYFFALPFRPFFTLLAVHALLSIGYWALAWSGLAPLPGITANPLLWHGHEMLFGFSAAAIAGFLLTAVANWTQRPPVGGMTLRGLCILWLIARLLWCWPDRAALMAAAVFDIAFNIALLAVFAREVIAANSRRNFKIAAVLLLYAALNMGFYGALLTAASDPSLWLRGTLYLVIFLIALIGGRIIPLFTGNWLRQHAQIDKPDSGPPPFNRLDLLIAVMTGLFMMMALAHLQGAGFIGIVAGVLQLIRVARWQGWRTHREPLLWSLHIGYAWVGIGLLLDGAAQVAAVPASAGLHALTVGAIGGLIIAVSSRVTLGHSGRPLTSHPLLTLAFVAINIAALARVAAALHPGVPLALAASAWLVALVGYSVRLFPIWFRPAPVKG